MNNGILARKIFMLKLCYIIGIDTYYISVTVCVVFGYFHGCAQLCT